MSDNPPQIPDLMIEKFRECVELLESLRSKLTAIDAIEQTQTEQLETIATASDALLAIQTSLGPIIDMAYQSMAVMQEAVQIINDWKNSAEGEITIQLLHNLQYNMDAAHAALFEDIRQIHSSLLDNMALERRNQELERANYVLREQIQTIPEKLLKRYA